MLLSSSSSSFAPIDDDDVDHREKIIEIVRILVEHARTDPDTADFLLATFKEAVIHDVNRIHAYADLHPILFEGGMHPNARLFYIAIEAHAVTAIQTLIRHGGNPFLREKEAVLEAATEGDDDGGDQGDDQEGDVADDDEEDEGEDDDDEYIIGSMQPAGGGEHAITITFRSPFHAAARIVNKDNATVVLRLFLEHWNERFAHDSFGQDTNGDYPIHFLCREEHVSIQGIELLVKEFNAKLSLPNRHGLLPFHLAVMSNASLGVIHYLLNQYPDALQPQEQRRLVATTNTAKATAMVASMEESQQQEDDAGKGSDENPRKRNMC